MKMYVKRRCPVCTDKAVLGKYCSSCGIETEAYEDNVPTVICSKCGQEVPDDSYCIQCGGLLLRERKV